MNPPLVCAISRLTIWVRSINSRNDELDRSSSLRIISTARTFDSQTLYGFCMRSICEDKESVHKHGRAEGRWGEGDAHDAE